MKHFVFVLCFLVASTFVTIQEALADSCPVRIAYAGLVGLGTPHGTAEYQLVFAPDQGYDTGPFTVNLTATTSDGSRVDFVVEGVSTKASGKASGTGDVRVYPFDAEARSFQIDSARDWKGLSTCTADAAYTVGNDSASAHVSFDDGPHSVWPVKSAGKIEIVDADFVNKQQPEYPLVAKTGKIEGDATVLIVINPDGSVAEASIYESSGSDVLDQASLNAARESTFTPAHLSRALGSAAITSAYLIVYTFNLMN